MSDQLHALAPLPPKNVPPLSIEYEIGRIPELFRKFRGGGGNLAGDMNRTTIFRTRNP